MRVSKYLASTLFCGSLFIAACSDGGNPDIDDVEVPDTPSFSVSSCQEVTDPSMSSQLETAKANISEVLKAIGDKDLESAQVISASNKSVFKEILDKYPSNCEAQLGYAVSIITDLINNKEIKSFIDSVTNKKQFLDMDVEDFNKYLINADGTKMTDKFQKAVASAIPSTDSAITFMKNIVADDKFVCNYTYEDRMFELDRGEFAPALAALYVVKSILTMTASLNIDFSNNGNYDWLNDLNENWDHDSIANETNNYLAQLLSKSSSFSTVYEDWKPRYKSIPKMLDSAISYVQIGLQYGIDESKNGIVTQKNDPYVVGDGEMADVSASDFQKAIDSLEYYRETLYSGVDITFPKGSKVKISLGKFFEITDGWQDYFPYHKVNDFSTWLIPEEGNFRWSESLSYKAYGGRFIERRAESLYQKQVKDLYSVWADMGGWIEEGKTTLYIGMDFNDGDYLYDYYDVTIDGCNISFTKTRTSPTYTTKASHIEALEPITLGPEFCKVEGGVPLFAEAYGYVHPNYITFTDANGNKTISWQSLEVGRIIDGKGYDYTLDDLKNFIIFPDITFGGILPGMTVEKFWETLKTETRDSDDDDDDILWSGDIRFND